MKYPLNLIDFHNDWVRLVGKAVTSYEQLQPEERTWYNIQALIDAVNKGGVISYYSNPGADHLFETMADLKVVGATQAVEILSKMNALFPGGIPSPDIDERNRAILSWNDDTVCDLLDNLDIDFYKYCPILENTLMEHILAHSLTMAI